MQKDILLSAAAITIVIFMLGLMVGFWIDNSRSGEIGINLKAVENQNDDARLQESFYSIFSDTPSFCQSAFENNLIFNDRIYEFGKQLDRYEEANRFSGDYLAERQKYALLQTQFWFNAINIKKKCNANYSTMVYFYSYLNESAASDQRLQSAVNLDVREECEDIVLVVLPTDLNITTIDSVKNAYAIGTTPSLLINEEVVLSGLQNKATVKKALSC